jgi:pullulanase/glycogen debranching enzyme
MPTGRSMDDRVRRRAGHGRGAARSGHRFHPDGDDLIRSKSMERDSYDSGDWFNRIDWTGSSNGWKSGLPNAGKDSANWPTIQPIFADATITPGATDIAKMSAHVQSMLKLRKESPLFRLRTAAEVYKRVDFTNAGPNQLEGVIVMTLSDQIACTGADLDGARSGLVVIINGGTSARDVTIPGVTSGTFTIPAVLGLDPLLTGRASWTGTTGVFHVEGRTTAVFERPQSETDGVPCNTKPHP